MIDLAELQGLIEIMAAERTRDHPELFEDAVQEGLIAAWRAVEDYPGKPESYYRAAARNGVMNPLRGRASFGAPSHRGKRDAGDSTVPLVVESDGGEVFIHEPPDPAAEGAYDGAIYDYVRRVVAALPEEDRLIVYGRYWADKGFTELAAELGRPAGTLSRRWTQIIRPRLAEALQD